MPTGLAMRLASLRRIQISEFEEVLGSLSTTRTRARCTGELPSTEVFYEHVPVLRVEDLQLARMPRPPLLPRGAVTNAHAVECALWLKAWVKPNYGTQVRWSRRTRFDKRRNWRAIRDGIELLQKHKISPARWCAFMGELILARGQIAVPGIPTVFGRGVVTGQIDFGRETKTELGGRVIATPRYKQLCQDYAQMTQDLRLSRASEPHALRAIVSRYFPGGSFRRRVAEVAAEAESERTRLESAVAAYQWVW